MRPLRIIKWRPGKCYPSDRTVGTIYNTIHDKPKIRESQVDNMVQSDFRASPTCFTLDDISAPGQQAINRPHHRNEGERMEGCIYPQAGQRSQVAKGSMTSIRYSGICIPLSSRQSNDTN